MTAGVGSFVGWQLAVGVHGRRDRLGASAEKAFVHLWPVSGGSIQEVRRSTVGGTNNFVAASLIRAGLPCVRSCDLSDVSCLSLFSVRKEFMLKADFGICLFLFFRVFLGSSIDSTFLELRGRTMGTMGGWETGIFWGTYFGNRRMRHCELKCNDGWTVNLNGVFFMDV